MKSLRAYARAAHFGPTMLITTISFLLAVQLWWEGPAYVIAFTVFLGQLLIGWLQEKYEEPGNGGWLPFIFGCIAGIVPWLSLLFYVFAIGGPGDTKAPAFVYGVVISIFVLFNTFAIVQYLLYKKVG